MLNSDFLEQMKTAFRTEAEELLAELDGSLLALEAEPNNMDLIHRIFRAVHTIKGSGATAGYDRLARFAHRLEEVFERARLGAIEINTELIDLSLRSCDLLSALLSDDEASPADADREREIVAALSALLGTEGDAVDSAPIETAKDERLRRRRSDAEYLIEFQPDPAIFYAGTDPDSLLEELREMGRMRLAPRWENLPTLFEMDPERCYLGWKIELATSEPESTIREVFLFVEEESVLSIETILKPESSKSNPMTDSADAPGSPFLTAATQCHRILERIAAASEDSTGVSTEMRATGRRSLKTLSSACLFAENEDLNRRVSRQLDFFEGFEKETRDLNGEERDDLLQFLDFLSETIAAAQGERSDVARNGLDLKESSVESESSASGSASSPASKLSQTLRVDHEKLDRLLRLAGELLVARGAFPAIANRLDQDYGMSAPARELKEAGASLSHLVEELQATVMSIRMLPVRTVFQRFPRLVRDLARNLDKEVELILQGEETELDKIVLDQIGDPLVHLLRNAVDHGVEEPDARRRSGKSEQGQIFLKAYTQGSSVVIELRDDGKGMDSEALKRKAVEKGLLSSEDAEKFSHEDALNLIFAPGFSTAERVTDVSGRGVGMDVVRTAIRNLQGSIRIESQPGRGTAFVIHLPTSLMVSRGALVQIGEEEYILPLDAIRDLSRVPLDRIRGFRGHQMVQIRGRVYPLIRFNQEGSDFDPRMERASEEASIAVIETNGSRFGLQVDRFVSEVEILLKPITGVLSGMTEYSGAAIMSDGRVVLVLNPNGLCDLDREIKTDTEKFAECVIN